MKESKTSNQNNYRPYRYGHQDTNTRVTITNSSSSNQQSYRYSSPCTSTVGKISSARTNPRPHVLIPYLHFRPTHIGTETCVRYSWVCDARICWFYTSKPIHS
ncbi:hypothetical protein V6N13_073057 [Hibiscus sabdariffa]|uniref:Uncharacterized protein n=1 Tax=Hibiscus sabdariffa TaxID=183260 RepID=A0ABR2E825_9ROSI